MPAKEWPRPWLPLDVDYFNQDTIRELGRRLGAGGPLAFLAIINEANRQALAGTPISKQGTVEMRYSALAMTAWLEDDEAAWQVVSACRDLELLELLDGSDEKRFEARLLKWDRWQAKDIGAAARQAKARARKAEVSQSDDDDRYEF